MKAFSYIAATLLLAFGLLCTLPFTAPGTRVLLQMVERTGMVRVEYGTGSLFGDLQLEKLAIEVGAVSLQLDQLHSRLDLGCFWSSTFCFEVLRAQSLNLDIISDEGEDADSSPSRELIEIPWAYEVADLQLQQLHIQWPGGSWQQGHLRAEVSIAGEVIDVAHAVAQQPQLLLEQDSAQGTGYQGFSPTEVFLPLDLQIGQLHLQQPRLLAGTNTRKFQALALSGSWRGFALQVQQLSVSSEEQGEISASGSLQFKEHWPMQVAAEISLDDNFETEALRGRHLQVELQGDLHGLQFAAHSPGKPQLDFSGAAEVVTIGLPFSAEGTLAWPQATSLGDLGLADSALSELQLDSPLRVQISGDLESQDLHLNAGVSGLGYQALLLTAQGQWRAPRLLIESIGLEDSASDSRFQASGELLLDQGWSLVARANSPGLYLPPLFGEQPGRVRGEIDVQASGDGDQWRVQIPAMDIQGTVNGLPANIAGHGGLQSSLRLLPGQWKADVNGASLSVDVSDDSEGTAQLSLQLDDLGRWLAGARGTVQLQGQGRLQGESLVLAGSASNIDLSGFQVPEATLEIDYGGVGQQFQFVLRVPELVSRDYQLDNLLLSLQGSAENHRLRLSSAGVISGELAVAGALQDGHWQGVFNPTRLSTSAGDWSLPEPVSLAWQEQDSTLGVSAHCWQHTEFELCSGDSRIGAGGDIDLHLAGNVKAFNGLLPRGLRANGKLDADLAVAWAQGSPLDLNGAVQARKLTVTRRYGMGERVRVTWQSVDMSVDRTAQGLALAGEVIREGRRVLTLDALLPETTQGPVSGQLVLDELQLSTLSPWLTELAVLEGRLSGTLALGGTVADISPTGSLHLDDGHLVVEGNPTELTGLQLDLDLDGESGQLRGAGLLGGGEINLSGQIFARPQLRLEMAVTGERHQILVPPASEMLVSENLTLVLTEGLLDVRGEVRVHEGVLRHEELPEGGVAISRDVVQVDLQGNVIAQESAFDVRADIWLRLRDRFRVEGETLKATLGGDLHLVQEPGQALRVFGSLNLQGGELFAYRQHLQVRRGTVAFSGPADNPELDIAAEREIRSEGITVGARLLGQLEEPVLEIYSDPVMSQGEAMSYLVRGRGLDSGAGADGTALALSVGADIVNRSGIVSEINRLPLISDVAFGASGSEEDTAATVSGYIGTRIYLSYGIGLYEPINVLTARLYLQSRLWLEVVSALENSVDLYYSFDID